MPEFSRFGTVPESLPDERDHFVRSYLMAGADTLVLPDEVGVRNVETHRSYVPITDQGQEGSCTGHALRNVKRVVELLPRTPSDRARVPDFGPRGIYHLAKEVGGYPDEEGAYLRDVVKAAQHFGTPREKDWPYVAGTPGQPATSRWLQYARSWGIGAYARVPSLSEALVSLHTIGPLFIAMGLTESFMDTDATGLVPAPSGEELGGHAMALLGAKQSERRFLVANSWGTGWGAEGYCWIDYSTFLDGPREMWAVPDMPRV